jgi:2-dehydro-3-deoxyphosphooctonate aldolase (KDO 8-P synthase)
MKEKVISLKQFGLRLSNASPMALIAGPCVIEDAGQAREIAAELKRIARRMNLPFIFKASYDKANRSSVASFRGPGLVAGLKILAQIREKYDVPVLTDIHCCSEAIPAAQVADILQIPAFLCRQTNLLVAAAKTGLPVNVKKGQFLEPGDMNNIVDKLESAHNRQILLTERGVSFGYHNLIVDMRSIAIMKETGYPVVFDATHSVQLPGGCGNVSGGQKEFVAPLARAATAVGIAALFLEVHPDPLKALSDGANSLALKDLPEFLSMIRKIDTLIKTGNVRRQ